MDTSDALQHDAFIAARVRAALAYASKTLDDAAEQLDMSAATLRRITSPTNPRGADLAELAAIALVTNVPRSWFERGEWHDDGDEPPEPFPVLGNGPTEARLSVIEHYLRHLLVLEEARGGRLPEPRRARKQLTRQAAGR